MEKVFKKQDVIEDKYTGKRFVITEVRSFDNKDGCKYAMKNIVKNKNGEYETDVIPFALSRHYNLIEIGEFDKLGIDREQLIEAFTGKKVEIVDSFDTYQLSETEKLGYGGKIEGTRVSELEKKLEKELERAKKDRQRFYGMHVHGKRRKNGK